MSIGTEFLPRAFELARGIGNRSFLPPRDEVVPKSVLVFWGLMLRISYSFERGLTRIHDYEEVAGTPGGLKAIYCGTALNVVTNALVSREKLNIVARSVMIAKRFIALSKARQDYILSIRNLHTHCVDPQSLSLEGVSGHYPCMQRVADFYLYFIATFKHGFNLCKAFVGFKAAITFNPQEEERAVVDLFLNTRRLWEGGSYDVNLLVREYKTYKKLIEKILPYLCHTWENPSKTNEIMGKLDGVVAKREEEDL